MALKDPLFELNKILCTLYTRPEAEAFRSPVAWKELGLTDYPSIVSSKSIFLFALNLIYMLINIHTYI